MAISLRTQKLKDETIVKSYKGEEFSEKSIQVCLDRARLWKKSHKKTIGEPQILRAAKAMKEVFENMTIYIEEGELIVGNFASAPNLLPFYPEQFDNIAMKQCLEGLVADRDKAEVDEIVEYWKKRNPFSMLRREVPEEERKILENGSTTAIWSTLQIGEFEVATNLEYLFKLGLKGIVTKIEEKLHELEKKLVSGPEITELLEKKHLFEAKLITCKAVINWTKRYSRLAKELAQRRADPEQKAELMKISRICERVLADPPQTFHEAVQASYFIDLANHFIESQAFTPGLPRLDQVCFPYYKKEVLIEKTMTREEAQEILECFFIKFIGQSMLVQKRRRKWFTGNTMLGAITIGGVRANGEDACNDLTLLLMDAVKSIKTFRPSLALRYHSQIPDQVVLKALDLLISGSGGIPSFRNDNVAIPVLMDYGISLEDARNWHVVSCNAPYLTHKLTQVTRYAWQTHAAKCLELALNNGVCMITGEQLGPQTGDSIKFNSYEEIVDAFKVQIKYALKLGTKIRAIHRYYEMRYLPKPLTSSLYEKTLEVGKDCMQWEEIDLCWLNVGGQVDVADSLSAIKKLVFEEKRYTMNELYNALKANWEGYEEMRDVFINKAPKFGNDDDYVDSVAREVFSLFSKEAGLIKDIHGQAYNHPHSSAIAVFIVEGLRTGALPNGRRVGDPLSDAGVSPYIGYDKKGPTAVLRSASKIDHRAYRGVLFNQRLQPTILKGEKGQRLFLNYIKTWADLGIDHIQFNIVDTKILREAQKYPEKYTDLMVRVAGYSAPFTGLNRETQDGIIARTEQVIG